MAIWARKTIHNNTELLKIHHQPVKSPHSNWPNTNWILGRVGGVNQERRHTSAAKPTRLLRACSNRFRTCRNARKTNDAKWRLTGSKRSQKVLNNLKLRSHGNGVTSSTDDGMRLGRKPHTNHIRATHEKRGHCCWRTIKQSNFI